MREHARYSSCTAAMLIGIMLLQAICPSAEPDDPCIGVNCGMGTCVASPDRVFGFVCKCEPNWSQFRVSRADDPFRFLPCIIPNCTFDYACYNESIPQHEPALNPKNYSVFDPCFWSYCGGGDCVRTKDFKHRCECKKGFGNILNFTNFPCVKNCAIGANCANLGFPLSFHPPPPNTLFHSGDQSSSSTKQMIWTLAGFWASLAAIWIHP